MVLVQSPREVPAQSLGEVPDDSADSVKRHRKTVKLLGIALEFILGNETGSLTWTPNTIRIFLIDARN